MSTRHKITHQHSNTFSSQTKPTRHDHRQSVIFTIVSQLNYVLL